MDSDELECVQRELERVNDRFQGDQALIQKLRRQVDTMSRTVDSFAREEATAIRGIGVRQRRLDEAVRSLRTFADRLNIKTHSSQPAAIADDICAAIVQRNAEAKAYLETAIRKYENALQHAVQRAEAEERRTTDLKRQLTECQQSLLLSVRAQTVVHVVVPLFEGRVHRRVWGYRCDTCNLTMKDPSEFAAHQPPNSPV